MSDKNSINLTTTQNGQTQLGGHDISIDLFTVLSLLEATSSRKDLVDTLKRLIVQMLASYASAKIEAEAARAINKATQPGFWSKLFGRK